MAGKIPEAFIQDLLARVDLVDLIDARLPLKRSGSNYVARCPFHNEKTPSFSVNRDKQFYYCFGCGAHGSAIGFLMNYDRLSFPEAVETLAATLGLKVPGERQAGDDERERLAERLYAVQDTACRYYQAHLREHPAAVRAVEYLKQRGLAGDLARRYRLGYAPPGHRNLPDDLPQDLLKAAGLVGLRDDGSVYDWFRDRIVFPIRDRRGRIVGFGGRVLGDGMPKYLNSPETVLFRKHREVYGLYELLQAVRKPRFILVVEGYMDVIALAQFDIQNAVATLGTATSTEHINLLFRHTDELVFCFDGDEAGRKAAWKALDASLPALRAGRQLRFLQLPEGHDPDSLVRAEGAERFLERIAEAVPFSDYFFARLGESLDLRHSEGRAALVKTAAPLIDRLPFGVFRDLIEQRLAELTGLEAVEIGGKPTPPPVLAPRSQSPSALRMFLALLLQHPELAVKIDTEARSRLIRMEKGGKLIGKLLALLDARPDARGGAILEAFTDTPEENQVARLLAWETQVADDKIAAEFLNYLQCLARDRVNENRLDELIRRSKTLSPEEREELRRLLQ